MQRSLLIDTPPVIVRAARKLERARIELSNSAAMTEKLKDRLDKANELFTLNTRTLKEIESSYVLNCCKELERLLAADGKGWCPICEGIVNFEKFGYSFTSQTIHEPERYGDHGYMGGTSARDYEVYTNYRVPHMRHHFREEPIRSARYGGTIADAPSALFEAYGIPPLDSKLLERAKPEIWSFVE